MPQPGASPFELAQRQKASEPLDDQYADNECSSTLGPCLPVSFVRQDMADHQTSSDELPTGFELDGLPGHNIRRLQQIAVAIFLQETADFGVTPVQYAALQAVANAPGIDQRSLARAIGFDTSTIAGVVDRLESRGLMRRQLSTEDRRVRLLSLSDDGAELLREVQPAMLRAQHRIMAPLSADDQAVFLRLLKVLVTENNEHSRAPSES